MTPQEKFKQEVEGVVLKHRAAPILLSDTEITDALEEIKEDIEAGLT